MKRSSASGQPVGVVGWLLAWTLKFMLHGQVRLGGASGIWACSGPGMARAGAAVRTMVNNVCLKGGRTAPEPCRAAVADCRHRKV